MQTPHDHIATRNLLYIEKGDTVRWYAKDTGGYLRGIVSEIIANDRLLSARPPHLIVKGKYTRSTYRVNLDNPTLEKIWEGS